MIRRFGFGLSILLLMALLAGVITFWIVVRPAVTNSETPADQFDQKIQPQPTPAYDVVRDYADSSAYSCEPGVSSCIYVSTEATGAKNLASITEDIYSSLYSSSGNGQAQSVEFYDASS
jgi:hypothetical protein